MLSSRAAQPPLAVWHRQRPWFEVDRTRRFPGRGSTDKIPYGCDIKTITEYGATAYIVFMVTPGPSSGQTISRGDVKAVSMIRRQGRPIGDLGMRNDSTSRQALKA